MLIIECDVVDCRERTELPSSNGTRGGRLPDGWVQIIRVEKPERDELTEKIARRRPSMHDPLGAMLDPSGGRARVYVICPNHPIPKLRELPADEFDDMYMGPG